MVFQALKRECGLLADAFLEAGQKSFQALKRERGHLAFYGETAEGVVVKKFQALKRERGHLAGRR